MRPMARKKSPRTSSSSRSSARSTVSGPSRKGGRTADALEAKVAAVEALAAAMPYNANKEREHGDAARPSRSPGKTVEPRIRRRPAARSPKSNASDKIGAASRASGSTRATGRSTACASIPAAACSPPTRACRSRTTRTRSRPGCAGRRCSKTSSCARRSRTSTTSAFPSASCTRAARARTAIFECYEPLQTLHARVALRRGRQAHAGVRALLDGRRRARLDRHRARRARLRGQVLHRRRQLGPRRQQHPGVLHPGRDEVSRPRPRGEARAAPRHAAGGDRARHVLGLRLADARDRRTC